MSRKTKIVAGISGAVLAISSLFTGYYNSDSAKLARVEKADARYYQVYTTDTENIRAVGKEFLGVVDKYEGMALPKGYTFDQVYEIGEIVFHDGTEEPDNCQCSCSCQCATCPTQAPCTAEEPTQEPGETLLPTDVPTTESTQPPPGKPVDVYVSGVGRFVADNNPTACSVDNTLLRSIITGKIGLAVNAHCDTKSVVNKNGARVPAYLESAGDLISPSTLDGGTYPEDAIGYNSYWFPNTIGSSTMTRYDTAFIELYDQNPANYVFHHELPPMTSILNDLPAINTVLKSEGRTTDVVQGKVVATGVSIYMRVGYEGTVVHFADQIIVEGYGSTLYISKGGDSGKNWRLNSDVTKGVCQNWGGNVNGTYSICSPWFWIFKGMHLEFVE